MKRNPFVISLYDFSGNMVRPWAKAGCNCVCVDLQHPMVQPAVERVGDGKIWYVYGDCRTWTPPLTIARRAVILFAFPPCTHVANSGGSFWVQKGTALLRDSLEMFTAAEHAARWSGLPFMIENPPGRFAAHIRAPNYTFQPWQFGDGWTKKTCLWTGNGFVMPERKHYHPPEGTVKNMAGKVGGASPGDAYRKQKKMNKKSATPPNFARAVFEANRDLLE